MYHIVREKDYLAEKKTHNEWREKIDEFLRTGDLVILYGGDEFLEQQIESIGKELDIDGNICLINDLKGKGGDGAFMDVGFYTYTALHFIVSTMCIELLKEITKDFYQKKLKKIFDKNHDIGFGKTSKIIFTLHGVNFTCRYYFPSYFDGEESLVAFLKIEEHFVDIQNRDNQHDIQEFLFDLKTSSWRKF